MGEIADAMISGEMCGGCGEYLGEDAGYPLFCSNSCAKNAGADKNQVVGFEDEE